MNEIFDRPNRATGPREVWERESDGAKLIVWDDGSLRNSLCFRMMLSLDHTGRVVLLPSDRYRIRTIPDEPWPPKTRIEKRRVVQFRYSNDDPDDSARVHYYSVEATITPCETMQIVSDEIRDCEVDESGKVISVLKEGE